MAAVQVRQKVHLIRQVCLHSGSTLVGWVQSQLRHLCHIHSHLSHHHIRPHEVAHLHLYKLLFVLLTDHLDQGLAISSSWAAKALVLLRRDLVAASTLGPTRLVAMD